MPRILTLKYGRAYLFGLVAMAFIGWGLYSTFNALRPPEEVRVRLAAGSSVTRRFQIAETFATESRGCDLFVDVAPTEGFEESLQKVARGELDLALVSSGPESSDCKDLRILAGLEIEPLHIFVRRELADRGLSLIEMIKGRRVNCGQPGTTDFMLANDLLRFLRLMPIEEGGAGDYTLVPLSKEELTRLAREARTQDGSQRKETLAAMPDVIMAVAALPGVFPQSILDTGDYCLVSFPHVEPFLMSELHHVRGVDGGVDRILVERATIHTGMYFGSSLTPAGDLPTIGLRTLLVARSDLPEAAVKRIMQSVFETDFLRRVHPQSPQEIPSAYKIHPAAQAYLDRDKPLLTGTFFDSISSFLSIFGAFSAGALSLYGYIRRRRIRRPGEYLEEIRKIDALASDDEAEPARRMCPEALAKQIDARLNQLKEQVIRDYCDDRVQGEMVLLSILSTLADSRSRLHVSSGRTSRLKTAVSGNAMSWSEPPPSDRSTERAA